MQVSESDLAEVPQSYVRKRNIYWGNAHDMLNLYPDFFTSPEGEGGHLDRDTVTDMGVDP